jgi:hypothetical protein
METNRLFFATLLVISANFSLVACGENEDYSLEGPIETIVRDNGDTIKYANNKEIITDFDELSYGNIIVENAFVMEKHNNNAYQGLAIYGDYLFQTYHRKACVDVYDLTNNKFVFSLLQNDEGPVHCNNADFGNTYYEETDPFPLLYLEYRGYTHKTGVYRIVNKTGNFELEKIQVLSFSACSSSISNNNRETSEMYITFLNENLPEDSLSIAKIDIPDFHSGNIEISLESNIVKEKFNILRNKANQDATIYKNKLFQLKGGPGTGELWIYDLIKHKTIFTVDWKKVGMGGEPEGIGWYKDHLVITNSSGQLYNLYFVK